MRHVNEGILRRIVDDPLAISVNEKDHLSNCALCRTRMDAVRADRQFAVRAFTVTGASEPNLARGMSRVKHELSSTGGRSSKPRFAPSFRMPAPSWAVAVAAVLALAVGFTPAARATATNLLTIFQPRQFSTLPVTMAELRSLPNLKQYGNVRMSHAARNSKPLYSLASAEARAGFHISSPSWIPSSVAAKRTFHVIPAQTSSFTFSARKAKDSARDLHKKIPPMPAEINGTTIGLTTEPASLTSYGTGGEIPELVIGQSPLPKVTSTGASLKTIENYVLRLPGVSPQLAQEIKSIGKPTSTLPIPIPVSWAFAQHVTVQGHPALLVGDNTGVASIVIWEAHGIVYGVGGSLTQGQVMHIADTLH